MAKREAESPGGESPAAKKIANADDARVRPEDDVVVRILVPYSVAGAIIGKKGEALRVLKQETRCGLKMSRTEEGMYPGTHERVLQTKGKVVDVQRCFAMIIQKIGEKLDANHPRDQFDHNNVPRALEMKFVVPNTSAGMVIGKQGQRIKEIRELTGVNIQVFPKAGSPEASRSQERVISVAANKVNDLEAATNMIVEKVASDPHHASGPDSFVHPDGPVGGPPPPGYAEGPFAPGAPPGSFGPGPISLFPQRAPSPVPHHRQAAFTSAAAAGSGYPGERSSSSSGGGMMAPSIKFNPLEGIGNAETLTFLDNLQTTLRTSGFTEQAVTEVMSAMQILAKYNIMGLGLGLGVAAMAQMRGGGSVDAGRGTSISGVVTSAPTELMSQSTMASLYSSMTPQHAPTVPVPPSNAFTTAPSLTTASDAWSNGASQPRAPSPAKPSNFAAGVIKEIQIAPNRIDLEIPELIVLAVLPPSGKRVNDIKQFTGVNIDTSKVSPRDSNIRVVAMQGELEQMRAARLMIERAINDEHARRQQQAARNQQAY